MLNICTVCKAEFEDDDSKELSDSDVCPECYKELYDMENDFPPEEDIYDDVDFIFEDLENISEGD